MKSAKLVRVVVSVILVYLQPVSVTEAVAQNNIGYVTKSAFSASGLSWPLTVDEGYLGCDVRTSGNLKLTPIWFQAKDGTKYAVNGAAANFYNPIEPIWLPIKNIQGVGTTYVDILDLLNKGLEICSGKAPERKNNICNINSAKATKDVIFVPLMKQFTWDSNEANIKKIIKPIAKRLENSASEMTAYIHGEKGYDGWVRFYFDSNKVASIMERHNNPNKEKSTPFVGQYLAYLRNAIGEPISVIEKNGNCNALWETATTKITAEYKSSEWYVEIHYEPKSAKKISEDFKEKVWLYYIALEDTIGREKATNKTAQHFKITNYDLSQIINEGIENLWPIPE